MIYNSLVQATSEAGASDPRACVVSGFSRTNARGCGFAAFKSLGLRLEFPTSSRYPGEPGTATVRILDDYRFLPPPLTSFFAGRSCFLAAIVVSCRDWQSRVYVVTSLLSSHP